MRFKNDFKQLVGKIKVWNKPIFDLDYIEKNSDDFIHILQDNCKINLTKPFIKPPTPKTVLGHTKETIRFNFGKINESKSDWLDHIEFGFGENGYFYDCIICNNQDFIFKDFQQEVSKIGEYIKEFESKIENSLIDFYFESDYIKENCTEISNCSILFEIPTKTLKIFNYDFLQMMETIKQKSEPIVKDILNFVIPELYFNIISESITKDPFTFNLKEKYLPQDRRFSLRAIPPDCNCWEISVRGVPIMEIIEILQQIILSND